MLRKVGVVAAIIVVIGAIIAALLGLAVPFISENFRKNADVQIVDARTLREGTNRCLEVVLQNRSQLSQPISKMTITLFQQGLPLMMIDKAEYKLKGRVNLTTGRISGDITHEASGNQDSSSYLVDGDWYDTFRGDWGIRLVVPMAESIPSGESRRIVFILPSEIDVDGGTSDHFTRDATKQFLSRGETETKFLLYEFITKHPGEVELKVAAIVSNKGKADFHALIVFR